MAEEKTAEKQAKSKKESPKEGVYAVIATCGKQYLVSEGDIVTIEKLPGELKEGDKVVFDNILLVDDGKDAKIGAPYVSGAKVTGVLAEEGKAKKVTVIKFKSKSRYFKKRGHRQPFMKVRVEKIA